MAGHRIGVESCVRTCPALRARKSNPLSVRTIELPANAIRTTPVVSLPRRLVAEALGTAFLLVAIVGSGILGERLSADNTALALLANSLATAAALYALIEWFLPLSGAHYNPLITVALACRSEVTRRAATAYIAVQMVGAVVGVCLANAMFDMPLLSLSTQVRSGPSQLLSEFVATFGLIGIVWVSTRLRPSATAAIVATYIGGAFWFTPTGFANPAVTVARAFTDTFSGIRPVDVPGFLAAQAAGAVAAIILFQWLLPNGQPPSARNE